MPACLIAMASRPSVAHSATVHARPFATPLYGTAFTAPPHLVQGVHKHFPPPSTLSDLRALSEKALLPLREGPDVPRTRRGLLGRQDCYRASCWTTCRTYVQRLPAPAGFHPQELWLWPVLSTVADGMVSAATRSCAINGAGGTPRY